MKKNLFSFFIFFLIFIYPTGCTPKEKSTISTQQEITVATISPPSPTIKPTPTATLLPPAPPPVETVCQVNPQSIYSESAPLENMILFVSNNREPVTDMGVLSDIPAVGSRRNAPQLWAISPDGQQANRLTTEGHGVAWHLPEDSSLPVWLMSNSELMVDEALLWNIPLPLVCDDFLELKRATYPACGHFEISPDGKWATFNSGDYITGYNAPSGLINLETGETTLPTVGTKLMQFLPNDERLVFNSGGEVGDIWLVNSLTEETVNLGGGGSMYWNADKTAFIVEWSPYVGIGGAVRAYDVPTKSIFTVGSSRDVITTHPIWIPDESTILYQQQTVITRTDSFTLTFSSSEIHIADILTGEDRVVLSEPNSNYYLCDRGFDSCAWSEDWIKVRRLPYHVRELYFENYDPCILHGSGCDDPVESLALNWRTGEVVDWDIIVQQHPVSTILPSIESVGPNLNAVPIYTNEKGGYALYSGYDNSTIWCVPENGQPRLWVQDADWFAYFP